jgi:AcrR family transcriptional regulator
MYRTEGNRMADTTAGEVSETSRSAVGRKGVLDVAARLFREQGYGPVSLRKIAEAAGIKAGSIYYHFGSKDEIVVAILDAGIQAVHDDMRQAVGALHADTGAEAARNLARKGNLTDGTT